MSLIFVNTDSDIREEDEMEEEEEVKEDEFDNQESGLNATEENSNDHIDDEENVSGRMVSFAVGYLEMVLDVTIIQQK